MKKGYTKLCEAVVTASKFDFVNFDFLARVFGSLPVKYAIVVSMCLGLTVIRFG